MLDSWWENKAQEVEHFAETHNSTMFISSIKSIYGPTQSSTPPPDFSRWYVLQSSRTKRASTRDDGVTSAINLLNRPSSFNNAALDIVPQQPFQEQLDLPSTLKEVKKAISAGKAPGKDEIPGESYKAAGPAALEAFHSVVTSIWEDEDR